MSDPVTNVDVEDVLSSIRRLVSDTNSDDRQVTIAPETAEAAPEVEAPSAVQPADALILTSALRVNSSEGDSQPDTDFADMAHFRHSVSDRGHTDASQETSGHADWPSMADDDYYEDTEQPESAPVIDFIRHGRAPKPEAASEVEDTLVDDAVEEAHSEEEHAEFVSETQSSDHQDWVEEDEHCFEADEQVSDGDEESEQAEAEAFVFEPEVNEEEAASDIEEAQFEDAEIEDDASEEIEDAEESLAEEVIFASAAAASVVEDTDEQDVDDAEVDLADFDESVIDEDALRDLVAEIVREELTGDLGERITRNVRKLVRREIHRALMTREFE